MNGEKSTHGGMRAGTGRPKGAKNKRTRKLLALADQAAAEGITPLEVMLRAMRTHVEAGDLDAAAAIAKDAAPYMHPRLSAVDAKITGTLNLEDLTDDELLRIVRVGGAAAAP